MYAENPAVVKVSLVLGDDLVVLDYTAKLVKSLLIAGNPELERVFGASGVLKPIHITPLYMHRQGRGVAEATEPVYARHVPKGSTAKPPSAGHIKPVRLEAGREYFFYVGVSSQLLSEVLYSLSSTHDFPFGRTLVAVEELRYEVNYVDVDVEAEQARKLLEAPGASVKVTFESPTLLKDPLTVGGRRWAKTFLPLPEAVLSAPAYMLLADTGRLKLFKKLMLYAKSVLSTPYTVLKTANIAWYIYDGRPLPALIGYVKYRVDPQQLNHIAKLAKTKHNIDLADTLAKTLTLAKTYGVGDGRAAGFGHTTVKITADHNSLSKS